MTRKQIDAAREARLWIGQIVIPAATVVVTTLSIPGVKEAVAEKFNDVKRSIQKRKIKKVEP